jgi:site-specific recombinase XerD
MDATPHRSSLKILPRPATNKLELAYDSFKLSLQAAHRSPRTIQYYDEKLRPFLNWLEGQGVTDFTGITATHIRAFLLEREQAGRAAMTVHHHAACIKAFLNFLVSEELLPASPMRKVKMPKLEQEILPAFTPEDVKKLLAATKDPRDTAIVLFLLDTGCRLSEFLALNVEDVDMKTGAVKIRLGKGMKGRVAFLGFKARKALNRYVMERGPAAPDEPLWLLKSLGRELTRERLTRSGLRFLLDRLSERSSVAHCHPHTFRRTFALWSLRAGMNIYALQQIMGHSDLTMLRRYLALVEEDLAEAHRKYGAVDNML